MLNSDPLWEQLCVGGGLPPIAVCQLMNIWLIGRYRGQAPSHISLSTFDTGIP